MWCQLERTTNHEFKNLPKTITDNQYFLEVMISFMETSTQGNCRTYQFQPNVPLISMEFEGRRMRTYTRSGSTMYRIHKNTHFGSRHLNLMCMGLSSVPCKSRRMGHSRPNSFNLRDSLESQSGHSTVITS